MTLQQLKYVIAIADKGSINEAAKALFISQPSLSHAVHELEGELGLTIFLRTNKGVKATVEGAEFLGYARQVLQQNELLEEKYLSGKPAKQRFSVSTQHYTFAANAFVALIKEFGGSEYEFSLRETTTYNIIQDVKNLRSEIGILYLSSHNESVIRKLLRENDVLFTELLAAKPHIFISRSNPLASRKNVSLADLEDFPCVTYEQGEHNSFYFSEEILSTLDHRKAIRVTDRSALENMLIGVNGYTISTGIFPSDLHGDDIIAVPLEVGELIRVGTLRHKDFTPTRLGEIYLASLQRVVDEFS
jgi:DNA-binding transcriptional LysR family regulator